MTSRNEQEVILDHVFESNDNLETALKLCFNFDAIKERLLRKFISDLTYKTLKGLGNQWQKTLPFRPTPTNVLEQWYVVGFEKKDWGKAPFSIALSAQKPSANEFIIGIYGKGKESKLNKTYGSDLKKIVDEKYDKGSSSDGWWWYQNLEDEYLNWTNKDFLLKLIDKESKTELIDYFKNELLLLAQTTESEISKMIKSGLV